MYDRQVEAVGYSNHMTATEVARTPEVQSQLRQLIETIERLNKTGEELFDRLVGVSRVEPPQTAGAMAATPHEVLCPVAEQLRNARNALDLLGHRINAQRNRLEI